MVSSSAEPSGGVVTFAGNDRLPKVCLRCGLEEGVKRRSLVLEWMSPLGYLGLPFGLIPYLVLRSFMLRTVEARLPFCDPCHEHWKGVSLTRGGLILAAVVVFIATLTVGLGGAPSGGALIALGGGIGVTAAWLRLLPPTRLRLRRIEADGFVIFDGVDEQAAEAIAAMDRA